MIESKLRSTSILNLTSRLLLLSLLLNLISHDIVHALDIVDPDDRVKVDATNSFPWSSIVSIERNGSPHCSGTLISAQYILTAGHCVLRNNTRFDLAPNELTVIPGRNGSSKPFGEITVVASWIPVQWLNIGGADNNPAGSGFDYAILKVSTPFSVSQFFSIGYFSDEYIQDTSKIFNISGYPYNKDNGATLWNDGDKILFVQDKQLGFQIDASEGQSGAAIWTFDGSYQVVGVYNGGAVEPNLNGGSRITPTVIQNLDNWGIPYTLNTDCFKLNIGTQGSGIATIFDINNSSGCEYHEYTGGTNVTLVAVPSSGWSFSHWIGTSGGTSTIYTVLSPATITAVFTQNSSSDVTLPTGSWISPNTGQSFSSRTVTLSVNASDTGGSGVREVRWAAKWGGQWYGIGTDTNSPYSINWDWCAAGVPNNSNEDVEIGFEVWDNANNKWVYSEHGNANIHIYKNYHCEPIGGVNWSANFYNNDQTHWWDPNDTDGFMCNQSFNQGNLDQNYGDGSPCGGQTDHWVGDYTGNVNFSAGNYAFWVSHDDWLKLRLDNTEIYSVNGVHTQWVCPSNTYLSGNHQIRAILYEDGGQARIKVEWAKGTTVCNPPGAFNKFSPSNPSYNQSTSPTLSWGVASGATSYSYCIDTINNNACDSNFLNVGTDTSLTLSSLNPGTTYYWQVNAYSQGGVATPADGEDWWSFTTQPAAPGGFNKTSPTNIAGSQSTSPTLNWSSSSGASWYQYCIDTTNNNTCDNDMWYSAGTDTSTSVFDLAGNTTYYWHVRANNDGGTAYANGNTWWSFTTQAPISPPSDIAATKGEYEDRVFVVWLPVTGATRYELWRNTNDSSSSAIRIADNVIPDHPAIVRHDDFSAAPGTTYYYWAKACNNASCSSFSPSDYGYRLPLFNLLMNGDFEDGSDNSPSWWGKDAWTPSYSTFDWDDAFTYSGNKSAKISTPTNANDAYWMQTVQVQPNSDYQLSGWIMTDNVAHSLEWDDAGANLSILDGSGSHIYSSPKLFWDNPWTYVTLNFNTGTSTQVTIAARLGMYSGTTTGWARFDDLKLVVLSTPTCYNLTKNVDPGGGGSVIADPAPNCNNGTQYIHGTTVKLAANPNVGYGFENWGGDIAGSTNPIYVTMTSNKTVTANFSFASQGTLNSIGANDGWTLESSETSNKGGTMNSTATLLYVGDNAQDKQYRSLLSFDTSSLPDGAVITNVQVKIRIQGFIGGNLFSPTKTHGNLLMDIRKPYFGTGADLVVTDFQAGANKNSVGALTSVPAIGWYTVMLKDTSYPFINLTGTTQFRLRFQKDDNDDLGADYLKIYSGNAGAASRPQLIVEYYVP